MGKREFIEEVKKFHTGPEEFQMTLRFYNIQFNKNGKTLCLEHNEKTPSAGINKRTGRSLHCFGCGANMDALKIVQIKEGLNFPDAVIFYWQHVLGRAVPDFSAKTKKAGIHFDRSELEAAEIFEGNGKLVPCACGYTEKYGKSIPDGKFELTELRRDDYSTYGKYVRTPSLQSLIEEGGVEAAALIEMVLEKAQICLKDTNLKRDKYLSESREDIRSEDPIFEKEFEKMDRIIKAQFYQKTRSLSSLIKKAEAIKKEKIKNDPSFRSFYQNECA